MTRLLRVAVVVTITALLVDAGASFAGAAGVVPPRSPAANVAARPAFNLIPGHEYTSGSKIAPCWHWLKNQIAPNPLSPTCGVAEVRATDHAHFLEHIAGATLPRNFDALTALEQLLVLVDVERVSRGEPAVLGLTQAADAMAQQGAQRNADPVLSNSRAVPGATGAWRSNWAAAVSPLDANYSWMYLDGWGGKGRTWNFDCSSAHAPGCWGHRNNVLVNSSSLPCYASRCALVMGAGKVAKNWSIYNSYTELIVQVAGATPPLVYSWKQALAAGARA